MIMDNNIIVVCKVKADTDVREVTNLMYAFSSGTVRFVGNMTFEVPVYAGRYEEIMKIFRKVDINVKCK